MVSHCPPMPSLPMGERDRIPMLGLGTWKSAPSEVLLRWGIQPGTVVLAKSVTPRRIEANLGALGLCLSGAEMESIAALERRHRHVAGSIWTLEGSPYNLASLWDEEGPT